MQTTEVSYPEMTIEEIETQFDGEWVLVGDPETNESLEVMRGKVLCHSANRDVVYAAMGTAGREFRRTATLCFKEIPAGMAVCFSNFGVAR